MLSGCFYDSEMLFNMFEIIIYLKEKIYFPTKVHDQINIF